MRRLTVNAIIIPDGQRERQGLSLFDELPVAPKLREGSTKASRTLHDAVAACSFRGCSGATTVAWRSLHQFNRPSVQPHLPKGRFHSESVIPSAQPCGVSIFELGLR